MALPFPISPSQTDAYSPVDDNLMDSIRLDLDYLDNSIVAFTSFDYQYKVNGPLNFLTPTYGRYKRLDGGLVARQQTFTAARLFCEVPGLSGTLEVDLRKYKRVQIPIVGIDRQFTANTNSITQIAPALATQSITRATAQVATQSISFWKASINVSSIIGLGSNLWRYNLASAPDSDYKVGDSILFAGCTTAANNGTFTIVRINDDGLNNIVITNASGVAQTGAVGTAQLMAMSYNYINPLNANFVAGEQALFASHSTAANNGNLLIYAVNQSGNNVIVKNATGVVQAGVAGTLDTFRMQFNYSSSVVSDFVVGELARMASHSTGVNNGDFPIRAVNSGGNNLILYVVGGVTQGGIAGTANTTRWIYALSSNPTSSFTVGQNSVISGSTNILNDGVYSVKQINRSGTDNIVISNALGVAQVGAAGTLSHTRMLIKFGSAQTVFTTASNVEIYTAASPLNNGIFDVLEINRGGGSNYNIVIENSTGVIQANQAGRIELESKSIFNNTPQVSFPISSFLNTNNNQYLIINTKTGSDFNSEATITAQDVIDGVILGFDVKSIPSGGISDVLLQLG